MSGKRKDSHPAKSENIKVTADAKSPPLDPPHPSLSTLQCTKGGGG